MSKKITCPRKGKRLYRSLSSNGDTIRVELVENFDKTKKIFDSINSKQNTSLKWLVAELTKLFSLTKSDFYRHPTVSRKQASEASTETW